MSTQDNKPEKKKPTQREKTQTSPKAARSLGVTQPADQTSAPKGTRIAASTSTRTPRIDTHAQRLRTPVPLRERISPARIRDFIVEHKVQTIVLAVILIVLFSLYAPIQQYYVAWRTQTDSEAQLAEIQAVNDSLKEQIQQLQTREGIEDEARRKGYVSEGETSVIVDNAPTDLEVTAAATPVEKPWYIKVLDFLFGYHSNQD